MSENGAEARREALEGVLSRDFQQYFQPLLSKMNMLGLMKTDPNMSDSEVTPGVSRRQHLGCRQPRRSGRQAAAAASRRGRLRRPAGHGPRVAATGPLAAVDDPAGPRRHAPTLRPELRMHPMAPVYDFHDVARLAAPGDNVRHRLAAVGGGHRGGQRRRTVPPGPHPAGRPSLCGAIHRQRRRAAVVGLAVRLRQPRHRARNIRLQCQNSRRPAWPQRRFRAAERGQFHRQDHPVPAGRGPLPSRRAGGALRRTRHFYGLRARQRIEAFGTRNYVVILGTLVAHRRLRPRPGRPLSRRNGPTLPTSMESSPWRIPRAAAASNPTTSNSYCAP